MKDGISTIIALVVGGLITYFVQSYVQRDLIIFEKKSLASQGLLKPIVEIKRCQDELNLFSDVLARKIDVEFRENSKISGVSDLRAGLASIKSDCYLANVSLDLILNSVDVIDQGFASRFEVNYEALTSSLNNHMEKLARNILEISAPDISDHVKKFNEAFDPDFKKLNSDCKIWMKQSVDKKTGAGYVLLLLSGILMGFVLGSSRSKIDNV